MARLADMPCQPCTGTTPRLADDEMQKLWLETPMWEIAREDDHPLLRRTFEFPSYAEAVAFTNTLAQLAETANHHPTLITRYKSVTADWYTHAIGGLHTNDFIMAAKTDDAYLRAVDESRAKSVVREASEESFPASDSPGWIGKTQEEDITEDMPRP